jgi:translation elongation factor EF-G
MGELHIEILHDRIRREYGIETHLGPLQVAYRETVLNQASATGMITERRRLVARFSTPSRKLNT